jgi:predicted AAA+ superfamily ATPase
MKIKFENEQIKNRIKFENPWWWGEHKIDKFYSDMKRREYFKLFFPLVVERSVKRALVLMGPRRVGKTVMIYHAIDELINEKKIDPNKICYLSVETPIYNGIGLEELLNLFLEVTGNVHTNELYVFFDEIQYLKDWEVHLKSLVDSYHNIKFIVSGSAAAALKMKSNESGAGRFTDFDLPPLTFHEYLSLKGLDSIVTENKRTGGTEFVANDIDLLNNHFIDYINYGGYPEVSLSNEIQSDVGRYIRNDIVDKVLLRDLPSLYGIEDVRELNSLFTYIAYHSGNEMSLDAISQGSGVTKNTITKYIKYLEAAFLIKVVHRIDQNAKKFLRANFFKIYLTNPSLRTALFSPIMKNDPFIGNMVETAIFSQWQHSIIDNEKSYYARWKKGEIDMVNINQDQKPVRVLEIKWSNRFAEDPSQLKNLKTFCDIHKVNYAEITTIDIEKNIKFNNFTYYFTPASLYCFRIGKILVELKEIKGEMNRLLSSNEEITTILGNKDDKK